MIAELSRNISCLGWSKLVSQLGETSVPDFIAAFQVSRPHFLSATRPKLM